jgi:hypothetical protein
MTDNTTQKDEEAEKQDKTAENSELKAAEANKAAAIEHEKQADKQTDKSKS